MQLLKIKYKNKSKKVKERAFKKSKIKVNLAILGGGDVIFPIIAAGAFYVTMGLLPALVLSAFSTIGLLVLFVMARKNKFYPAMPFLTMIFPYAMLPITQTLNYRSCSSLRPYGAHMKARCCYGH